jgi:hypothetical protein
MILWNAASSEMSLHFFSRKARISFGVPLGTAIPFTEPAVNTS